MFVSIPEKASTSVNNPRQRVPLALWVLGVTLLFGLVPMSGQAQSMEERYARAEQYLSFNADSLVLNEDVDPNWIEEENQFWYLRDRREGKEFVLINAGEDTRQLAFDHARLATALSERGDETYDPYDLPFDRVEFVEGQQAIRFTFEGAEWQCDLTEYTCEEIQEEEEPSNLSPNGKWEAFVQDHNLFVRSTENGREIQLTFDGEQDYAYATPLRSLPEMVREESMDIEQPVQVEWGPDSKKLVTYRLDQRSAKKMAVVQSSPEDHFWPQYYTYTYPFPGETGLPLAEPVIIDIESRSRTFVKAPPSPLLYTGGGPLLNWSEEGQHLYYRNFTRGNKKVQLFEVDPTTGDTKIVVEEESETYVDPNISEMERVNGGEEVLWTSERDGWNHLYLYDGQTGELSHQVTDGEWVVREIEHVDVENRHVYFTASGREEGDPYLRSLYRVGLDGTNLTQLTPERADHSVDFSPSGDYFVDTYSRVDQKPITVLRKSSDGEVVRTLEEASTERLQETGWTEPEPFRVKAADGETDIYGLMWRPSNFDPSKEYPVVEQIYTGPHDFHVPKTFEAYQSSAQAIAELGFITVMVDGRGTGRRSQDFRLFSYENLGNVTVDHVAALNQLAERHDYLDTSRVGIYGHSAGGYDSAHALLTEPEIYDVAVSSGGNHDHRLDKAWWNELYMGYPVGEHYEKQSNITLASELRQDKELLLVHGELDNNVPPSETLRMVNALIEENKDFDFLIMPNQFHGLGGHPYFVRTRWDYFVEHLHDQDPPVEYEIER